MRYKNSSAYMLFSSKTRAISSVKWNVAGVKQHKQKT